MKILTRIGYTDVISESGAVRFESGITIDADGSPFAYHPVSSRGLDALGNAGRPGNWWGIATRADGRPYIQKPTDPAPGFYVSTTALIDGKYPPSNPRRYVDSQRIPFIVLPPQVMKLGKVRLGDYATVINSANDNIAHAIVADIGPKDHIGEGSIKLAELLGISGDARRGGAAGGVVYVVYPGSGDGRVKSVGEIKSSGAELFSDWGGVERAREVGELVG